MVIGRRENPMISADDAHANRNRICRHWSTAIIWIKKTFHERYEAMPEVRAELIGGLFTCLRPRNCATDTTIRNWLS